MTIPSKDHPTYLAAKLIYAEGSKTEQQLWTGRCGFSERPEYRAIMLERAIGSAWLRRLPDGRIALTEATVEFFDTEPRAPTPKGQIAAPRQIDLMSRAPFKSNLNPRGNRGDIPAWSVRPVGFSIKSIGGGEA